MLANIDDNLDTILKEKEEYYKQSLKSDAKSVLTSATKIAGDNVFSYTEYD